MAKALTSLLKHGTIKADRLEKRIVMLEMELLGRINIQLFEQKFGQLQTDEIVITSERLAHICKRHPEDYALFLTFGKTAVENPDFLIADEKNEGTVFAVKKMPGTNLNVVVRLALSTDTVGLKNSVMTFYRIREKNLKKLLDRNELLYKRE